MWRIIRQLRWSTALMCHMKGLISVGSRITRGWFSRHHCNGHQIKRRSRHCFTRRILNIDLGSPVSASPVSLDSDAIKGMYLRRKFHLRTKGMYTWSDLHTCANFAYMQNLHMYANRSMCTHSLTYAKFARMQKLENLHLPQTKCKSHFAYMQSICKFCIYASLVT